MSVLWTLQDWEPSSFCCHSYPKAISLLRTVVSAACCLPRGMDCLAGLDTKGDAGKSFIEELMWEQLGAAVGEERAEQCWVPCSYLDMQLQCQPAATPAPTGAMKTWPYLAAECFSCCLTPVWLVFLFLKWASAFLLILMGKVSVFNAPSQLWCGWSGTLLPGCGVGWEIWVAWAYGTMLHPGSVYTQSRRIDFQQHLAWVCHVLVFCNLKEVKLFLDWGIGTQKDLSCVVKDIIWGVPLDKLEQFIVRWILEMLGLSFSR